MYVVDSLICNILPELCMYFISLLTDDNTSLIDESRVDMYLGHYPSGSSTKIASHYG